MANISIKKDFEDGQKLFAQQLNNNFETIELGINAGNKLIWKDDNGAEFQTFRGTTEEIENRPIIDGQELYNIENGDTFLDVGETRKDMNRPLWKDDNGAQVQSFRGTTAEVAARPIIDGQTLYNIETGETALDVGDKRISTGAGNVVYIGDEEPQNDATKIWIENDQVLNLGSEVAISSEEPTTQEKVWIQRGKNLIDKNLLIFGMELDGNGGTLARSNYYITPFIEIESNTIYTFKGAKSLKGADNYYKDYYDKDYNFISSNEISTFTTPSNAKYVRFNGCSDFTIDLQLEKGEKITPKKIHTKTDNGYEELTKTISLGLSANDAEIWLEKSKNLYDEKSYPLVLNLALNPENGETYTTSAGNYYATDKYVPIDGKNIKKITFSSNVTISFYTSNKTFISGGGDKQTYDVPSNARYLRFDIHKNNINNIQIEQGEVATTYEPFKPKKIHTKTDNGYEEFYNEENREVYSTSEQRIGTWIDGKPLYRRVFKVPETSISSSGTTTINFNLDGNVDVKKMSSFIKTQTSNYGFNLAYNGISDGFRMRLFNNTVQILASEDVAAEKKITSGNIIVEYTKTTD